jgi:hypothetical protein
MKKLKGWKRTAIIIVAVFVLLWLMKAPLISGCMTEKLGVPVSALSITMRPSYTKVWKFKLANPTGYRGAALKAEKVEIDYRMKELKLTPSEIDLIELDNVELHIFIDGDTNNWKEIGAKMPRMRKKREVVVHKFVITNLEVIVKGGGRDETKHFDQLEFDDIDSLNGFPTRELVNQIFGATGFLKFIEDTFNPVDDVERVLDPFSIF